MVRYAYLLELVPLRQAYRLSTFRNRIKERPRGPGRQSPEPFRRASRVNVGSGFPSPSSSRDRAWLGQPRRLLRRSQKPGDTRARERPRRPFGQQSPEPHPQRGVSKSSVVWPQPCGGDQLKADHTNSARAGTQRGHLGASPYLPFCCLVTPSWPLIERGWGGS